MIKTLDLKTEHLQLLMEYLDKFLPSFPIWAFGSRVKGTAHFNSDLDLVIFSGKDDAQQFNQLRDELDESNLPFIVDLHVWEELPKSFQEVIRENYLVLRA